MDYSLDRKLVVEFIGMFIFAFTVGMATQKATGAGTLTPLAIGFVLMVMVFAGGHISGAHYNPAVSTAVLLRGKMAINEWLAYVVTQLVAAVLGGLLARGIGGHETATAVVGNGKMFVVELVFTLALTYTVLNVATARGTEGNSHGLAIGGTVPVGAFAVGGVHGHVQAGVAHRLAGCGEAAGVAHHGPDRGAGDRSDPVLDLQRRAAGLTVGERADLAV